MPPRDIPDSSNIISTRRRTRKPRAPDEVVSFAPPTRPMALQQQTVDPAPPDSMVQAIQSPPPQILLAASTIAPLNSPLHQPSPLPPLITPHPIISDRGQQNGNLARVFPSVLSPPVIPDRDGENDYLTGVPSSVDSMPPLASPTASQRGTTPSPVPVSEREPAVPNESVLLIDEDIWPSRGIISELLELRGTHSDQVEGLEHRTSESETESDDDMAINAPALPIQHQPALVPQPSGRVQAEMRAAAAERRRAYAAAISLPARPGDAGVPPRQRLPEPAVAAAPAQNASPATMARAIDGSTQAQVPASAAAESHLVPVVHPIVSPSVGGSAGAHSEVEPLQTVLHARLGDLLTEVALLSQYGSAYIAIRQTMIMEKACARFGFRLGIQRDAYILADGQSILQSHLIKYFSFGAGQTFWNSRCVHRRATQTRDFIEQVQPSNRQGHQNETLDIIEHMLDATMLVLPCAAGSASIANSLSRPAFDLRCQQATGKSPVS